MFPRKGALLYNYENSLKHAFCMTSIHESVPLIRLITFTLFESATMKNFTYPPSPPLYLIMSELHTYYIHLFHLLCSKRALLLNYRGLQLEILTWYFFLYSFENVIQAIWSDLEYNEPYLVPVHGPFTDAGYWCRRVTQFMNIIV